MLSSRFRTMCTQAGLGVEGVAKILHVTPRTVRYWFTGHTLVPYSAYKLLRVMRYMELPGKDWQGWHMHSGKLWSPEGYGFVGTDSSWWGALVRRSALFHTLYEGQLDLKRQIVVLRDAAQAKNSTALPRWPELAMGDAATAREARLDLSLGHFRTYTAQILPSSSQTAFTMGVMQ